MTHRVHFDRSSLKPGLIGLKCGRAAFQAPICNWRDGTGAQGSQTYVDILHTGMEPAIVCRCPQVLNYQHHWIRSAKLKKLITFRRGATYTRLGGHHVGHWPTFLVLKIFSIRAAAIGRPPKNFYRSAWFHHKISSQSLYHEPLFHVNIKIF